MQGPFQSETINKRGKSFEHQIKLRGNLYNEVENVEVTLTADSEDRLKDLKFKVCFPANFEINSNLLSIVNCDINNTEYKLQFLVLDMYFFISEIANINCIFQFVV